MTLPPGPEPVHLTVHLTTGKPADTGPWWRPRGYWKRTALTAAAVLVPWPGLGAPAAWWAHLLGRVVVEASPGAAWILATAAAGTAWLLDRRRRVFDPERRVWRPAWAPRALLATALVGACLALPVFTTAVNALTGASL